MSATQTQESLQWMVDVGVPKIDVMWLASMQGSPQLKHPVASRRVQQIQDLAFKGLMATITHRAPAMA